jgi:hypothetical protein
MTIEEKLKDVEQKLAESVADGVEKDALIVELQEALSKADTSSLEVKEFPTVAYKGETYQVRAKSFHIGVAKYEVADLADARLVAKAIADGLGWLVKIKKPVKTTK